MSAPGIASTAAVELTVEQKRAFYRDGLIVLRNMVPSELTFDARQLINNYAGRSGGFGKHVAEAGGGSEITDLINQSPLGELMTNTMGPYDPPIRGFTAVLYPREASKRIGIHGLPEDQVPNYGFDPHLDGSWTGPIPDSRSEIDSWQSPRTPHFGKGDANTIGTNGTPLFQDPKRTVSLASYTVLVGVALNDQTEFGRGNLCLLKGAHHEVERFFRMQREQGGPVGPEGPGWPRLIPRGEDGVGLNYMPEAIRGKFTEGAAYSPDGTMWPSPTPILLDEGDAVLSLHATPHSGTRNAGADPRMNVYFRLRRHRPGGAKVTGDSDHPDRRFNGEFRSHEPGYDPFQISVDAMCDHWSEWDGMAEVVAEERRRASGS